MWRRLGIDRLLGGLTGARRDPIAERVLFALVANRALAPSSKLAATGWVARDVALPGLAEVCDDACYRAMDWLLSIETQLARGVYDAVADLLNLDVDLIFFDATSTYFETDDADPACWRDTSGRVVAPEPEASREVTTQGAATSEDARSAAGGEPDAPPGAVGQAGLRTGGKSQDARDDLPQVIVGMAVTREGIPVRVWSWPGHTADSPLIRRVKSDLRDWTLGKVIWVADRGFTSAAHRPALAAGGGGYILGEKLRCGSAEATAALARPGRYQQVAENLRVKEVHISDHERFVACHHPEAAERDAAVRAHCHQAGSR